MLLRFGLSASPSGQLLYLILREALVKSAFFDGIEAAGDRVSQERSAPCVPALGQSRGNFSILSLSLRLSNRPSVTISASPVSTLRQLRGVGTSILDPKGLGSLGELQDGGWFSA